MFNWYSLPSFGAMLLFWVLAAYILTRSPRGLIPLTAFGAQAATASYLFGQAMQANAPTLEDWLPWSRGLLWGAAIAPTLWYWLTALLLRAEDTPSLQSYARWVALPAGAVFSAVCLFVTGAIYIGDGLYAYSATVELAGTSVYSRFHAPLGPLYAVFVAMLAGTTLFAALNVGLVWHATKNRDRRRQFGWLLWAALLILAGANSLGISTWLAIDAFPTWLGHLLLAGAMIAMAWNVAAYSLLLKNQVIRRDFFYFLTGLALITAVYTLIFAITRPPYSFGLLAFVALSLTGVVLSHALIDLGRRALDRLFFASDVQLLRTNLSSVVQSAALSQDLDSLLEEAKTEIDEVSAERFVSLTEQALRRLNSPAALVDSELCARIPLTLRDGRGTLTNGQGALATPLDRAHTLREVLVSAIERLKPEGEDTRPGNAATLQYNILREEYLQGLLNKQIMARHAVSEGTFHRNRRQAIRTVAIEIHHREEALSHRRAAE
ncbi:MAG: hypothetical protein HW416_2458 [Chloroflexi bacterium]|nr:hypothetical protein [Chloroflexota bacterium]